MHNNRSDEVKDETGLVIDAHQHFWNPETADYPWMTDEVAAIRQRFSPRDLEPLLRQAGVSGTVLVQTRSSVAETREYLEIASQTGFVKGVVGWVDLSRADVDEVLHDLKESRGGEYLVGIRHQVHDEPDPDWLLSSDVQAGLSSVAKHGLVYELLVRSRELPAALAVVRNFPGLRFVIDHVAKPGIRNREWDPWFERMRAISQSRQHVWCKLSGMLTEADWHSWTEDDIKPYAGAVLDLFGPERCMFGSDWPVCTLAASYSATKNVLESLIRNRSREEIRQIMGANAIAAYRLAV